MATVAMEEMVVVETIPMETMATELDYWVLFFFFLKFDHRGQREITTDAVRCNYRYY